MLRAVKRIFDIREGELKVTLLMQGYIFLIVATLLIIKPSINALFISDLGADSLPFAYLLVAIAAVIASYFYSLAAERFALQNIIKITLMVSIVALILLGAMLHLNLISGSILYIFYAGVAIYAVLATSQFWMLANLVFNVREAKRLFGLIGSGAIIGGIFGGYLTTILAPLLGGENLMFLAAVFLMFCFPILGALWKEKLIHLNQFKQKKRNQADADNPLRLIKSSRHLMLIAAIIAVGVIVARLVDYQFSSIADKKIVDSDELTSFFGFWLSSFNLISLLLQLFLTRRIVGIWGVGFSLMMLPVLIFLGGFLFFIFPELWVVTLLKGIDGSFKQSINKSAMELIALPLPLTLKKKTKSFIDVVVDSIATGVAGIILIFFIRGMDVSDSFISGIVIILTLLWAFFVFKVRKEYFLLFRKNLESLQLTKKRKEKTVTKESILNGMIRVFAEGDETEVLFMLKKAHEINDNRLFDPILALLSHPSSAVKVAVIQNLYYLNSGSIALEVKELLTTEDDDVVEAVLDYLLLHAERDESLVFDKFLNHQSEYISGAALICLAKESRDNEALGDKYQLKERIEEKYQSIEGLPLGLKEKELKELIEIVGQADYEPFYWIISEGMEGNGFEMKRMSIEAAGNTMNSVFVDQLLLFLEDKQFREVTTEALLRYSQLMISVLQEKIMDKTRSINNRIWFPKIIADFNSQVAVNSLIAIFIVSEELQIRLECLKELIQLKRENEKLIFDKNKIARLILEECKLYDMTIYAMHKQIIIQYLKKKKHKVSLPEKEIEARDSLMELLERRLEASLERIFKLLELRYPEKDIQIAYKGILSEESEQRTNAIEFLDILLNQHLKDALIPIIEATILDTSSEDFIERINHNRYTEYECFEQLLNGKDHKVKLAVLYLIGNQKEKGYRKLILPYLSSSDKKIKDFANSSYEKLAD